jgi:hypothetical protein
MQRWVLLYFGIALEADVPILEALWCSQLACAEDIWNELAFEQNLAPTLFSKLTHYHWNTIWHNDEGFVCTSPDQTETIAMSRKQIPRTAHWRLVYLSGTTAFKVLSYDETQEAPRLQLWFLNRVRAFRDEMVTSTYDDQWHSPGQDFTDAGHFQDLLLVATRISRSRVIKTSADCVLQIKDLIERLNAIV